MIRFVFIVCLCLGIHPGLQGQTQPTQEIMTLPLERQFAEKYWRFHPGNNPVWARSDYSDLEWAAIPPTIPIRQNQALWQVHQGWFRLPFRVSKNRVGQPLQLVVEQFGSSTWHLDGKPLATVSPVNQDNKADQRITQYIALRVADTNRHVLAVHYRFRPQPIYYAATTLPAFRVQADQADRLGEHMASRNRGLAGLSFGLASLFLILGLVHLLVYRATSGQQINQWLAATQLSLGLFFLLDQLSDFSPSLTTYSVLNLSSVLAGHLAYGLLLTVVYRYVRQPLGWIYWLLISLLTVSFVYRVGVATAPDEWDAGLLVVVLLDYGRVSWLGKRHPDRDAHLPWHSLRVAFYALLGLLFFGLLVGILAVLDWFPGSNLLFVLAFGLVAVIVLSVPLGLSLSLVRDYARTHQSLRQHIQQVEQLSARTLAQEQEKQALLAKQNQHLEEQVQVRTAELHHSLEELRITQDQLIQREKLASLGELTAGIAHEIQNPLNFVNNFSEVSAELITELKQEREKGQPGVSGGRDSELEDELLDDLQQNLQKIAHHGGRASAIVNGMLDHSRSSTGEKRPTDPNALAEEYLKLAYYGLKAKDKEFNSELVTDFSPAMGLIEVVPQEIGRVLLNIYNNAFYAVKAKQTTALPGYQPTVTVSTRQLNGQTEIRVSDNGTGIPESIKAKIFQPFFTTKPTGEGTGLGLSLSYDIVTKGHAGNLTMESQHGQGTTFLIQLSSATDR